MIDLDLLEHLAQTTAENGEYESVLGPQMLALVRVVRATLKAVDHNALDFEHWWHLDPNDGSAAAFSPAWQAVDDALAPFRVPVAA